jgi:hypothetical protein
MFRMWYAGIHAAMNPAMSTSTTKQQGQQRTPQHAATTQTACVPDAAASTAGSMLQQCMAQQSYQWLVAIAVHAYLGSCLLSAPELQVLHLLAGLLAQSLVQQVPASGCSCIR